MTFEPSYCPDCLAPMKLRPGKLICRACEHRMVLYMDRVERLEERRREGIEPLRLVGEDYRLKNV